MIRKEEDLMACANCNLIKIDIGNGMFDQDDYNEHCLTCKHFDKNLLTFNAKTIRGLPEVTDE